MVNDHRHDSLIDFHLATLQSNNERFQLSKQLFEWTKRSLQKISLKKFKPHFLCFIYSLIPNPPDVITQSCILGDVIVRGGNWHLDEWWGHTLEPVVLDANSVVVTLKKLIFCVQSVYSELPYSRKVFDFS
jgi:hypothetical protein